ncbi:RHS repeat protein [Microbulbifer pacificus]|uniref:RHS repeat protein n=1 Tax=Microbulbifer pacificus TaxID=407164 RepID=UPI000CF42845|nr:RHS repeat protein [Microbulbifer pacificus]
MSDPDKGTWRNVHNPFNELIEQTDAKGQKVENTYDALGRASETATSLGAVDDHFEKANYDQ